MKLPEGLSNVSVIGPTLDPLSRSAPMDNVSNIKVLPYTNIVCKVENVNCFDENDKMRYKTLLIDQYSNQNLDYQNFGFYVYTGCGIIASNNNPTKVLAGRVVRQFEVTRNNITSTYIM